MVHAAIMHFYLGGKEQRRDCQSYILFLPLLVNTASDKNKRRPSMKRQPEKDQRLNKCYLFIYAESVCVFDQRQQLGPLFILSRALWRSRRQDTDFRCLLCRPHFCALHNDDFFFPLALPICPNAPANKANQLSFSNR